jgi:hypothetical protein
MAFVNHARRMIDSHASRLETNGHIGKHKGDGLMFANQLSHRFALHRVLCRLVQCTAGQANGTFGSKRTVRGAN